VDIFHIETAGGKVSVSKNTNYIVTGEDARSIQPANLFM
jgi:hypothetical protein